MFSKYLPLTRQIELAKGAIAGKVWNGSTSGNGDRLAVAVFEVRVVERGELFRTLGYSHQPRR